jgi:hypothetical protein
MQLRMQHLSMLQKHTVKTLAQQQDALKEKEMNAFRRFKRKGDGMHAQISHCKARVIASPCNCAQTAASASEKACPAR